MNEFTNDNMEPVRKDMLTKGLEKHPFENSEQWKLQQNDRMIDEIVWRKKKERKKCARARTNERHSIVYYTIR